MLYECLNRELSHDGVEELEMSRTLLLAQEGDCEREIEFHRKTRRRTIIQQEEETRQMSETCL